jgi:DNA-binding beta-propeller fold protein YncE
MPSIRAVLAALLALLVAGCASEPPPPPWSKAFAFTTWGEKPPAEIVHSSAVISTGADDAIAVGGAFPDGVDFSSGAVSVAVFSASGNLLHTLWLGDTNTTATTWTPAGDLIACGGFAGSIVAPGGFVEGLSLSDTFVVSIDAHGRERWLQHFSADMGGPSGIGSSAAASLALDPDGNIFLVGGFTGTFGLGGPVLDSGATGATYVAKLDPEGRHLWSRKLHAEASPMLTVAADASGGAFVAAKSDFFQFSLEAIDAKGGTRWSRPLGDNSWVFGIAVDPSGNLVAAGTFNGALSVGGLSLEAPSDTPSGFVIALSSSGDGVWARRLDGVLITRGALAVSPEGHTFFTGTYVGAPDLGGGRLPASDTDEGAAFVVELDAHGEHVWSRGYAQSEALSRSSGIAAAANGDVVLAGVFNGRLDLGAGVIDVGNVGGVFLARIDR